MEFFDREVSNVRRNITSPIGMAVFNRAAASYGVSGNPSQMEDQVEIEKQERYEQNEHNLVVMNCKRMICEILLRLLDLENDMQISAFLALLKRSERNARQIPEGKMEAEEEDIFDGAKSPELKTKANMLGSTQAQTIKKSEADTSVNETPRQKRKKGTPGGGG